MRSVIAGLVVALTSAAPAFAQSTTTRPGPVVFLAGGEYGTPARASGTAALLIGPARPLKTGTSPDSSRIGVLVGGRVGMGASALTAGLSALALEGPWLTTGFDALAVVSHTTTHAGAAVVDTTYVGGEFGLVLLSARLSAGASHRTSAAPTGKATIFTWSVGVRAPIGW
jgi:hypothetical protein